MQRRGGAEPLALHHRTGDEERGRRLDEVVAELLHRALQRPIPRSAVRRLIMSGSVRRNGRPWRRPAFALTGRELLEAAVREERLAPSSPDRPPSPLSVLFEDDVLIAVDKPAGLPTHATADMTRPHLVGLVIERLRGRGAEPYLGVHQRLDSDTSGVVLFTKDRAANTGLARQFAERNVAKLYHALTARPRDLPPQTLRISTRLDRCGRRATVVSAGGQAAETDVRVVEALPSALLVEIRPLTGRRHQIRAHLAEAGMPILGDPIYGSDATARKAPRTMLHAVRLRLNHPVTGEPLTIESPHPQDFARLLEALRHAPKRGAASGAR